MNPEDHIKELLDLIEKAVTKVNEDMSDLQDGSYSRIQEITKDLKVTSGSINNTAENYRLISKLKTDIEGAILNEKYQSAVNRFLKSFKEVADLQAQYYKTIEENYSPSDVNKLVLQNALEATAESLTESGINANVISKVDEMLKNNVSSGAKYSDMLNQMKEFMTNTSSGEGALVKYVNQITTDSINQFSANYNQTITADLNLDWFIYSGTIIKHSRPFCEHLVEKKYVHKSEIPTILSGNIDGVHVHINPKTDLPDGMIPGTNPSNFQTLRGGYQCGHQLISVSELFVPENLRRKH